MRRELSCGALALAAGARPRPELSVTLQENAEDLWNERSRVHGLSMDLLIVSRVTLEACVEIAAKHDAHLNGAKGLADACEFHLNFQKLRNLNCFESSQ